MEKQLKQPKQLHHHHQICQWRPIYLVATVAPAEEDRPASAACSLSLSLSLAERSGGAASRPCGCSQAKLSQFSCKAAQCGDQLQRNSSTAALLTHQCPKSSFSLSLSFFLAAFLCLIEASLISFPFHSVYDERERLRKRERKERKGAASSENEQEKELQSCSIGCFSSRPVLFSCKPASQTYLRHVCWPESISFSCFRPVLSLNRSINREMDEWRTPVAACMHAWIHGSKPAWLGKANTLAVACLRRHSLAESKNCHRFSCLVISFFPLFVSLFVCFSPFYLFLPLLLRLFRLCFLCLPVL